MRPTLLAIDCSGEPCSVALQHGEHIVMRSSRPGERQSERVLAWVDEVLRESGQGPEQLEGLAVGIGPGGFTGVRLAVAVVQGLALAWNLPVRPVSSLTALARALPPSDRPILAVLDARMGEVYAGWFRHDENGRLQPLAPERVLPPEELSRPAGVENYRIVGSGQIAHGQTIAAALGDADEVVDRPWPSAREVLILAAEDWPRLAMPGERLEPAYLRDKVALTSAEQAAARARQGG